MALHQGHSLLPKLGAELSFREMTGNAFSGPGRRDSNPITPSELFSTTELDN